MRNDNKLLFKNSLMLSIAPFLPKAVNLFLLPIMTRYLTADDYGIAGTISAYTQAIGAFSLLGFGVVLMNEYFKSPETYKETWRHIYGFLNIWLIIFAIIQATILFFCIPEEAQTNKWWIIILTNFSTVFFGSTGTIGSSYYIYSKQSFPIMWRSVLASILTIAVDFVLIVNFKLGYMGWYIGTFVGTFVSNATYWYTVDVKLGLKPIYRFKWSIIKHALSVGIPTIPHYYSSYLMEGSSRILMDSYHIKQSEIGRVSISQQISEMFNMGMTGINNALSPYLMNSIKERNDKRIIKILFAFTSLIFLLAFMISLWSKEILSILLSNESLASAYKYLILYIMAFCYRPLYLVVSSYFFYFEKTKRLLYVSLLAGCIGVILYAILIPIIGVWGILIGHYIACLYYGYSGYFHKVYRENTTYKPPIIIIVSLQIVLTAIAYYCVDLLFIKLIMTIVILSTIGIACYVKRKAIRQLL